MNKSVAILFARKDSIYKEFPFCDVYDIDRDARNFPGGLPVIAHPPCRAWGRLRHFAKPRPDEKELAFFALDAVRKNGGVLEHPALSLLWREKYLPSPAINAGYDAFGGFSLAVPQKWWGHRAEKETWLYICGVKRADIPLMPFDLKEAPCVIETRKKNNPRPSLSKKEREATPPEFAKWLCELAMRCRKG